MLRVFFVCFFSGMNVYILPALGTQVPRVERAEPARVRERNDRKDGLTRFMGPREKTSPVNIHRKTCDGGETLG